MKNMPKLKKILGKKWTYPALYIIAVVAVLGIAWGVQTNGDYSISPDDIGLNEVTPGDTVVKDSDDTNGEASDSVATTNESKVMTWPVEKASEVYISKKFFDVNATEREMENAIVTFQGEKWPHSGVDFMSFDNSAFNVSAALDGEVIRAEKDPVVGYIVELMHENNVVTKYASIEDLQVEVGNQIKQGDIIGVAGRSIFEKEHGVHLHFEVEKDNVAINPETLLNQNVSDVLGELENDEVETTEQ